MFDLIGNCLEKTNFVKTPSLNDLAESNNEARQIAKACLNGNTYKALQLILSLSILVVLHELGHFLPAKYFKTKVEKFYLFFDPWFSIFKKKVGETEYGVGWLPLGGYVKIAGMIDESMDKEQMKKPPQDWEFRAKPAWQRLIIMTGGVIVNLLLGVFIYSMTLYTYGDKFLSNKNLVDGVWCVDKLSSELGFSTGDKIIGVRRSVEGLAQY